MEWYHYGIAVVFVLMVISPVWFFRKVEKVLFDAPEPELHVQFINPNQVIQPEESMDLLSRDEKILENLNKMIKTSRKKHVKQMWKIKKAEFERKLHWQRTSHVS